VFQQRQIYGYVYIYMCIVFRDELGSNYLHLCNFTHTNTHTHTHTHTHKTPTPPHTDTHTHTHTLHTHTHTHLSSLTDSSQGITVPEKPVYKFRILTSIF
jgi:hypothetical protein